MTALPRSTVHLALALIGGAALTLTPTAAVHARPAPTVQGLTERITLSPTADPTTSQTITWRGDHGDTALVRYAPADDPEQTRDVQAHISTEAAGTYYTATLTGLTPATAYDYRVGDGDTTLSAPRTFTTAAPDDTPFDFLYFGDTQNDITEEAAPVVRAALQAQPDAALALHAGDLINTSTNDAQWAEWYDAYGPAAVKMNQLAAPGNHEYSGTTLSPQWTGQFPGSGNGPTNGADLPETTYYTDYQGVRFIVLNSNYRNAAPISRNAWLQEQARWLDQALTDNPGRWSVVTFHHPVFSNTPGRDNPELRNAWMPVFEDNDIDLVLQGHDHSYSRGNLTTNDTDDPTVQTGPVYTVAVTGPKMYDAHEGNWTDNGARVRAHATDTQTYQSIEVDGTTLEYQARTIDGQIIDAFTIVKDDQGKTVTDRL
ncbi:metallophosphoesterase family protein [Nocardiopsis sp. LDBS1602]|uniref:metallophosphoesterase family protein n=1 Tax=Nocardiopsis sp. LDBS1602 TaxID=3109597 RepID=UPI002DB6289C|nr:metallophosphoesterase family protein [Nocardiopsis sp. LDBS1602]MEC3891250.1 metallophosphoesterase family protein [Nocardiopsis sp. LDBS1602]